MCVLLGNTTNQNSASPTLSGIPTADQGPPRTPATEKRKGGRTWPMSGSPTPIPAPPAWVFFILCSGCPLISCAREEEEEEERKAETEGQLMHGRRD